MISHSITFVAGLIIGSMFFTHSQITKLISPDFLLNAVGFGHLTRDTKALFVMLMALVLGLSIRAIARKKGAQR